MKNKTKAESRELRAESRKAARSLAAHKANWTRALRRAFPAGGPALAAALPAEIDREQCLRAMRRTDRVMLVHENVLSQLRAKQIRRLRELEQIEIRLGAQRREREVAAQLVTDEAGGTVGTEQATQAVRCVKRLLNRNA